MSSSAGFHIDIPSLPSQWQGSPDDLLQFLAENGMFSQDGDFPSAQVGGSRPTADVGIWYGETSIERFINGKYRPISDVPIGACLPWAGTTAVAPDNYLFAIGQLLLRTDYPELFAVIGIAYNQASDPGTSFRIPDYRGRVPVGSGVGDYIAQGVTGKMTEVVAAQYTGFEWIRNAAKAAGAPKTTKRLASSELLATGGSMSETYPPRVGQQFIIRYR